ncbi:DsbA family protein [Hyphococcus sp.]|uniref:DsbA family protein n=1 Tax=Hyphococcus sp. TaxID=2038636 RepID=UPI003CCBC2EE
MSLSLTPFRSAALAASFAFALAACGGANSSGSGDPADGDAPAAGSADAEITEGDGALSDMTVGSADAPVTVIEYASTTCPHCATFHETVYPEIKEKYVDTGKVRFVFREFPTAPANLAFASSMLARCAADKGGTDAYFVVLDALFKTQRTWIGSATPRAELLKIAAQANMTESDFDACVNRQELVDFLNENISEGSQKYNISSTPSFVVNGETRHFSSAEDFSEAIDAALADAGE